MKMLKQETIDLLNRLTKIDDSGAKDYFFGYVNCLLDQGLIDKPEYDFIVCCYHNRDYIDYKILYK